MAGIDDALHGVLLGASLTMRWRYRLTGMRVTSFNFCRNRRAVVPAVNLPPSAPQNVGQFLLWLAPPDMGFICTSKSCSNDTGWRLSFNSISAINIAISMAIMPMVKNARAAKSKCGMIRPKPNVREHSRFPMMHDTRHISVLRISRARYRIAAVCFSRLCSRACGACTGLSSVAVGGGC